MNIRCPHCYRPIEVVDDSSLSDVLCPSCGSSFSMVGDYRSTIQCPDIETVGHFKLTQKLGVGAFGTVWRARDTELGRNVAIKMPRKGQLTPQEAEQFLREARAAAQLQHTLSGIGQLQDSFGSGAPNLHSAVQPARISFSRA